MRRLVLKEQLERGLAGRPGAAHRGPRGRHCAPRGRHGGSIVCEGGLSRLLRPRAGRPSSCHPGCAFPMQSCAGSGLAICTRRLTAAPQGQRLNDFCLHSRPPRPPAQNRDICSPSFRTSAPCSALSSGCRGGSSEGAQQTLPPPRAPQVRRRAAELGG